MDMESKMLIVYKHWVAAVGVRSMFIKNPRHQARCPTSDLIWVHSINLSSSDKMHLYKMWTRSNTCKHAKQLRPIHSKHRSKSYNHSIATVVLMLMYEVSCFWLHVNARPVMVTCIQWTINSQMHHISNIHPIAASAMSTSVSGKETACKWL